MTAASIAYLRPSAWAGLVGVTLALTLLATPGRADDVGKPGELIETAPLKPAPELNVTDMNEQPAGLAAYRGKPLIVNLWATWCAPCVKEMPSLARLGAAMKDRGLAIVAVSEDRSGKFGVEPFLKQHNVGDLPIYLDKPSMAMKVWQVSVLPTTLLIDAEGREIGRVVGDREWDTAESQAQIVKLFGFKSAG